MRLTACAIPLACLAMLAHAQDPLSASFEAASVRPRKQADVAGGCRTEPISGNRLNRRCRTPFDLLALALSVRDYQISVPRELWPISNAPYDIEAVAVGRLSRETAKPLILSPLTERFQLQFLNESRELPVYALVNLERLGPAPPKVWARRANPVPLARLSEVSRATGFNLAGVNVAQAGNGDSHPFLPAHIPVIAIHSVTPETLGILHSARDRIGAINSRGYYPAYKTAYYLAYFDSKLD